MKYLPVFYALSKKPCLVVGAGEIAVRKIHQLKRAEADIIVVAPKICGTLKTQADNHEIQYIAKHFSEEMLNDKILVIVATSDQQLNKQISDLCKAKNIPVNVVDQTELCSFIMPAIIYRDPVQIAISTGGASPVLARSLRAKLEVSIPEAYGRLAKMMGEFREQVKKRYPSIRERRRFWEHILQGPITDMIYSGQDNTATDTLQKILQQKETVVKQTGEIYLVGAGPGSPDLLTFRALRLIQQAEVVLYDRLVAPEIVELARKDAKYIYVGKKRDQHALHQSEINQLLIDLAKQGNRVLRLKGGDPFIFGRGGEEIESLSAQQIPFQVVPGVTAALGCASYAGIPLTHRDYAHTCIFTTGHLKNGNIEMNWDALIRPQQTIAVYMGISGLDVLCKKLMEYGMSVTMPAALIQQGTTLKQKVCISNVQNLSDTAKKYHIQPPAMLIIGEVVKLHKKLSWFEPQN